MSSTKLHISVVAELFRVSVGLDDVINMAEVGTTISVTIDHLYVPHRRLLCINGSEIKLSYSISVVYAFFHDLFNKYRKQSLDYPHSTLY